jgi:uncharacterized protein YhjY with autotransporter beta-barrel domain
MANHCRLAQATATAICNTIADLCDAGGTGTLVLYVGSEPTHANDAAGGAETATCALAATAYGAASYDSGNHWSEADLASTASDPHATGNVAAATHFRLINGGAATVLQGTVGLTSGYDLNLNAVVIGAGAQVDVTSLEIHVPIDQA